MKLDEEKPGTIFSLKDQLFNQERVQYLAGLFCAGDELFNASGFVRDVMRNLLEFELKERIVHIASTLEAVRVVTGC